MRCKLCKRFIFLFLHLSQYYFCICPIWRSSGYICHIVQLKKYMVSIIKLDCCFNSRLREVCKITEEVCPHKRFTKLWTFSVAPFAPHPPSTDTSGHCCLAPCCSNTNSNGHISETNDILDRWCQNSSLVEGFHLLFHERGGT